MRLVLLPVFFGQVTRHRNVFVVLLLFVWFWIMKSEHWKIIFINYFYQSGPPLRITLTWVCLRTLWWVSCMIELHREVLRTERHFVGHTAFQSPDSWWQVIIITVLEPLWGDQMMKPHEIVKSRKGWFLTKQKFTETGLIGQSAKDRSPLSAAPSPPFFPRSFDPVLSS